MKRILFFIALCLLACSCNLQSQLEATAEIQTKQCPMELGNGIVMTRVDALPGLVLQYTCEIEGVVAAEIKPFITDEAIADSKEEMIRTLVFDENLLKMSRSGVVFKYVINDDFGDLIYEISITQDDLK